MLDSMRAARNVADEADKWFAFFHRGGRLKRTACLLAAAAAPVLVGLVLYFLPPFLPALGPLVGLVVAAGSLFTWASDQTKWLAEFRDAIVRAQHQAEDELLPSQRRLEPEKEAAEQQLKKVTAEFDRGAGPRCSHPATAHNARGRNLEW